MRFNEVLCIADIDSACKILETVYYASQNDIEGYKALISDLKMKCPATSAYQIQIEHVREGCEEYEHVYAVLPEREDTFGLEFCSAEEWLGMELTAATLKNYSPEDIVAHCLWEMTFFGFSDEERDSARERLVYSREDAIDASEEELFEDL